jgi:hypothetical protein
MANGTTKNSETYKDGIQGRESGIQFFFKTIKAKGSKVLIDKSYLLIQNSWQSLIKLFQGNIAVGAPNDININAGNNIHMSAQNVQITSSGKLSLHNKKGKVDIQGEFSDKDSENVKKYHDYLKNINNSVRNKIKNAQPEQTVCSNCAQQHLVDDKSDNWATIFEAIERVINILPFLRGPFDAIRWFMNHIYVATPGVKSNLGLNQGKGVDRM